MVQRRERLRFTLEAGEPISIRCEASGRILARLGVRASYQWRDTPRPCRLAEKGGYFVRPDERRTDNHFESRWADCDGLALRAKLAGQFGTRRFSSSNLAAYLFSPAVQLCTMVMGDVTPLSGATLNRNRPSRATAYCARAENPAVGIFPPAESRAGKSATVRQPLTGVRLARAEGLPPWVACPAPRRTVLYRHAANAVACRPPRTPATSHQLPETSGRRFVTSRLLMDYASHRPSGENCPRISSKVLFKDGERLPLAHHR